MSHVQATNKTQTGIYVNFGHALYLTWAAFAFSLASVLPYVIRCAFPARLVRVLADKQNCRAALGHSAGFRLYLVFSANNRAGHHVCVLAALSFGPGRYLPRNFEKRAS